MKILARSFRIWRIFFAGFWTIFAIFWSGCAPTKKFFTDEPISDQNIEDAPRKKADFKLLYIKSPQISYYDYALIRSDREGTIVLELFKLGKNFGNITVAKNTICFLNDCAPKWPSSKKFFGKVAYGDLFDDILLARDIFEGKGRVTGKNGAITQRFTQSGQVIFYERTKSGVLFRNLTNGVVISLETYVDPSAPQNPPQSP